MKRILRSLKPVSDHAGLRSSFVLAVALALLLAAAAGVHAQSGGTFELTWFTVDGGGATALSGGTFELGGSAGQPDAGILNGGSYTLSGGFWLCATAAATSADIAVNGADVELNWIAAEATANI